MLLPEELIHEQFCYLTTTGRTSGEPREIEIWFAAEPATSSTIYMLAGGGEKSNWVRNIGKTPAVRLRIGGEDFRATGRRAKGDDEDAMARQLLLNKYAPSSSNDLSNWGRTALPIAFDINGRTEA